MCETNARQLLVAVPRWCVPLLRSISCDSVRIVRSYLGLLVSLTDWASATPNPLCKAVFSTTAVSPLVLQGFMSEIKVWIFKIAGVMLSSQTIELLNGKNMHHQQKFELPYVQYHFPADYFILDNLRLDSLWSSSADSCERNKNWICTSTQYFYQGTICSDISANV